MGKKDKRIDTYIAASADFAKPVLSHLRKLVHTACPDVEETMKWSFPHFDYKGEMMCSMASFKQHCAFGFWKAKLMKDPENYLGERKAQGGEAMGHFGRIASLQSLPPDKAIVDLVKQAMKLNDTGVKLQAKPKAKVAAPETPPYFLAALKKSKAAMAVYKTFTPGKKKEYIEWLNGAKTETTRNARTATAVEWIAEGKTRHWKYKK